MKTTKKAILALRNTLKNIDKEKLNNIIEKIDQLQIEENSPTILEYIEQIHESYFFIFDPKINSLLVRNETVKVVLHNMKTNELLYFGSIKHVVRMLGVSRPYIYNAYKNNWLVKEKYKVMHIANVPKYNAKTGKPLIQLKTLKPK